MHGHEHLEEPPSLDTDEMDIEIEIGCKHGESQMWCFCYSCKQKLCPDCFSHHIQSSGSHRVADPQSMFSIISEMKLKMNLDEAEMIAQGYDKGNKGQRGKDRLKALVSQDKELSKYQKELKEQEGTWVTVAVKSYIPLIDDITFGDSFREPAGGRGELLQSSTYSIKPKSSSRCWKYLAIFLLLGCGALGYHHYTVRKDLHSLRHQNKQLQVNNTMLVNKAYKLEAENVRLRGESRGESHESEEEPSNSSNLSDLTKKIKDLNSENAYLHKSNSKLEKENSEYVEDEKEFRKVKENMKKENERLNGEVESYKEEIKRLNESNSGEVGEEIKGLKEEKKKLSEEKKTLEEEKKKDEEQISRLTTLMNTLNSTNINLDEELKKVKEDVKNVRENNKELEENLKRAEETVKRLREGGNAEGGESESEISKLEEEVKSLGEEVDKLTEMGNNVQMEKDKMEIQIDKLEEEIKGKDIEVADLKEKNKELQDIIEKEEGNGNANANGNTNPENPSNPSNPSNPPPNPSPTPSPTTFKIEEVTRFITGSSDGSINLWTTGENKSYFHYATLHPPQPASPNPSGALPQYLPIRAMNLSTTGHRLHAWGEGNLVYSWNMTNLQELEVFNLHSDWVTAVVDGGSGVFSAGLDGNIFKWGSPLTLQLESPVIAMISTDTALILLDYSSTISVLDLELNTIREGVTTDPVGLSSLLYDLGEGRVALLTSSTLSLYDTTKDDFTANPLFTTSPAKYIMASMLSHDKATISLYLLHEQKFVVLAFEDGSVIDSQEIKGVDVNTMAGMEDGSVLISGRMKDKMLIWDGETLTQFDHMHTSWVNSILPWKTAHIPS